MITNRLLPLRAILASALGLASLGAGAGAAVVGHAPAAAVARASHLASANHLDEEGDTLSISLTPSSPTLAPDGTMTYVVSINNNTADDLEAGIARIMTDDSPIESRSDLGSWLNGDAGDVNTEAATVPVPALAAGGSFTSVPVSVSAESLRIGTGFGAYPVELVYTAGDTSADARTTAVVTPADGVPAQRIAVAMPITVPAGSSGLIDADALETYTGPAGVLTKQLNAVIDRPVAIGIDPMIIASIRALGTAAPPSATAWLERLDRAVNEIFPLQYGDADPTVQSQAGASALLAPTSLAWGLDPAAFLPTGDEGTDDGTDDGTGGDGTPTPTGTPPPTDPVDPTETPAPPTDDPVPTLDELLDWDYTMTDVAWPGMDTVVASDLPVLAASGATTTLISSDNVSYGDEDASPWASSDTAALLVADAQASDALTRAASEIAPNNHAIALGDLAALLAVVQTDESSPILLAFDRGWKATGDRLSDTISALQSMPGYVPTTLSALTDGAATPVTIADKPQDAGRVSTASHLIAREADVERFATVAEDPSLITGRERAELMSLLAVSWRSQPNEWAAATAGHDTETTELFGTVAIASTTPVNMIANQTNIRVPVRNDLTQPVTVILRASPSNPRLDIDAPSAQVIPAQSVESVTIPVVARLGNGDVTLRLDLFTTANEQIGQTVLMPVNVRADWETIGLVVLIVVVVVLFVGGLVRTILKRRAHKAERDVTAAPASVDGPGSAESSADVAPSTDTAASGDPEREPDREHDLRLEHGDAAKPGDGGPRDE